MIPYEFPAQRPPALSEARLRAELDARRLRRQAALVALAGLLLELALVLAALLLRDARPLLSRVCAAYALFSLAGAPVLAAVYCIQRRRSDWQPSP